jgi:outer membrane autotransporter protein
VSAAGLLDAVQLDPRTTNPISFRPSEGHDSAVVSARVSVQVTPAITTYVNYDGKLGRGNYDSNAVTGGVRISF